MERIDSNTVSTKIRGIVLAVYELKELLDPLILMKYFPYIKQHCRLIYDDLRIFQMKLLNVYVIYC